MFLMLITFKIIVIQRLQECDLDLLPIVIDVDKIHCKLNLFKSEVYETRTLDDENLDKVIANRDRC